MIFLPKTFPKPICREVHVNPCVHRHTYPHTHTHEHPPHQLHPVFQAAGTPSTLSPEDALGLYFAVTATRDVLLV